MELIIKYDKEMNELSIRNELYSNCTYECKSLNEVGEIVQEFIDEYIKER